MALLSATALLCAAEHVLAEAPRASGGAIISAAKRVAKAQPPEAARAQRLRAVKSWGYQLKRLQVEEVAASPYDLVVIDYAPDRVAGVEHPFTPEQVAAMQTRPDGGRRLVLAYLSIGEAEWYRTYWKPEWEGVPRAPWLGPMNPRWYGNFPVRYWEPEWQRIVFGGAEAYLDRIVAAGFDGVYLDRADTYEDFEKTVPNAAPLMAQFITGLAAHARALAPTFLVVMQNAEDLLARKEVLQALDGIAKEDLYYGINHDEKPNPKDGIAWSLEHLKRARDAGKAALLVEYVTNPAKAADVRRRALGDGLVLYLAPRDLGHFALTPPDLAPVAPGPAGRGVAPSAQPTPASTPPAPAPPAPAPKRG